MGRNQNQNNLPEIEIQAAMPFNLEMCKALLVECNLPTEGMEDQFQNFIIMRYMDILIGTIGLEQYQTVGLLRSLAILAEHQKKGLGSILVNALLGIASEKHLKEIYLLTQTAEPFFTKLGFEVVERSTAPEAIQKTKEFTHACPKSAVLMRRTINS